MRVTHTHRETHTHTHTQKRSQAKQSETGTSIERNTHGISKSWVLTGLLSFSDSVQMNCKPHLAENSLRLQEKKAALTVPQRWACMYALCVSGAVNIQGYVWKFYVSHINFHSFVHSNTLRKKKVVFTNRPFITTFTSNNLSNFISLCTFCDLCCLGVRLGGGGYLLYLLL